MSSSVRKRAGGDWPEETFSYPQFEKGRKYVPEAELEHVSAANRNEEIKKNDEENIELLKKKISNNLVKIEDCLSKINDLTKEVEQREDSIKNLLQDL